MAAYYFDTSSLVKRYVREIGTAWVVNITNLDIGHELFIVRITGPEIVAAFFRKVRTQEMIFEEASRASEDFRDDFESQYRILEVTEEVVNRAMTLVQQYNLRGYDSVQLASALELHERRNIDGLNPLTFICADDNLNTAAESEGLNADNPNTHV